MTYTEGSEKGHLPPAPHLPKFHPLQWPPGQTRSPQLMKLGFLQIAQPPPSLLWCCPRQTALPLAWFQTAPQCRLFQFPPTHLHQEFHPDPLSGGSVSDRTALHLLIHYLTETERYTEGFKSAQKRCSMQMLAQNLGFLFAYLAYSHTDRLHFAITTATQSPDTVHSNCEREQSPFYRNSPCSSRVRALLASFIRRVGKHTSHVASRDATIFSRIFSCCPGQLIDKHFHRARLSERVDSGEK